ncbi:MAG: hypothetical protein E5W57_07630 [Mesorhizobium sp.]|nr:MAG: hypothetical protein E5W57_07630 [Mesorhizobium sp.]
MAEGAETVMTRQPYLFHRSRRYRGARLAVGYIDHPREARTKAFLEQALEIVVARSFADDDARPIRTRWQKVG